MTMTSPAANNVHVSLFDMVNALSTALDIINPALDSHQKRTCFIAASIARAQGMSDESYSDVFASAILHDIGAIALWERLKLLEFEDESPHLHARLGALLLERFEPFRRFSHIVRCHHVQWNHGQTTEFDGQPVPLESHLIYLADRIEVLAQGSENIIAAAPTIRSRIAELSNEHFHPQFVEVFLQISVRESFWLDLMSHKMNDILLDMAPFKTVSLDLDQLAKLARFYSLVIDSRSRFTATHSAGVATCGNILATRMGMSQLDATKVKIAGYLHDLGKLGISNKLIEKPGKLDANELSMMKTHSYMTFEILSQIEGMSDIANWASSHHERLDGSGYPFHKVAQDLPLGARVLCVADVYTALTENRPYRSGMETAAAMAILNDQVAAGKLDTDVVSTLSRHLAEIEQARIHAQTREETDLANFWEMAKLIPESPFQ
jgi:HD-GYP domain-containing protein (c-di-GMP phosphodiesterase class II)